MAAMRDAHERGAVLDRDRSQRRIVRLAEVRERREVPGTRLAPRLPQGPRERRPVRKRRNREHDRGDAQAVELTAAHEVVDRERDRNAAADHEREDRGEERPEEALATVPERVLQVRRALRAAERHQEQHLVDGVGGRVNGLREHRGRSRYQAGEELRGGDDRVGGERDHDALAAAAAPGYADGRGRLARRKLRDARVARLSALTLRSSLGVHARSIRVPPPRRRAAGRAATAGVSLAGDRRSRYLPIQPRG